MKIYDYILNHEKIIVPIICLSLFLFLIFGMLYIGITGTKEDKQQCYNQFGVKDYVAQDLMEHLNYQNACCYTTPNSTISNVTCYLIDGMKK